MLISVFVDKIVLLPIKKNFMASHSKSLIWLRVIIVFINPRKPETLKATDDEDDVHESGDDNLHLSTWSLTNIVWGCFYVKYVI